MILKRFLIILFLGFMVLACSGNKKPKNLISKKKMVNILIDAKLIASANMVSRRIMTDSGVNSDTYIFKKYNIDSIQFAESNTYYTNNIRDYEEIYKIVTDSLDKLKAHFKEIQEKEQIEAERKSKDSLNAILKARDSIKTFDISEIRDSLSKNKPLKEIKTESKLINPVSDN